MKVAIVTSITNYCFQTLDGLAEERSRIALNIRQDVKLKWLKVIITGGEGSK